MFPDPRACVPDRARPDAQRRRGFRIGCTVDGPEGPVRLDVAVQAEPELRIVGERLTAGGLVLLETALRDPSRRTVQAAWHTAGSASGDPRPAARRPARHRTAAAARGRQDRRAAPGARRRRTDGRRPAVRLRLRSPARPDAGARTDRLRPAPRRLRQPRRRALAYPRRVRTAARAARRRRCAPDARDRSPTCSPSRSRDGTVRALLDRGDGFTTALRRLGDGELRYLGPRAGAAHRPRACWRSTRPARCPPRCRPSPSSPTASTARLDPRQRAELLRLAARMCERGHIRARRRGQRRVLGRRDGRGHGGTPGAVTEPLDVAKLQRRLADFAAARNWQPYHTPKNLVAALSVEASELVEIFQWLTPEQSARVMDDPDTAHRVTDEVADVLAYSAAVVRGARASTRWRRWTRRSTGTSGGFRRRRRLSRGGVAQSTFTLRSQTPARNRFVVRQISVFLWLFVRTRPHSG